MRRLTEDGLVRADPGRDDRRRSAPEEARAHLDLLWDRLLDVDTLDQRGSIGHGMSEAKAASSAIAPASYQVTVCRDAAEAEAIASRLEEAVEPPALAVSLFDRGDRPLRGLGALCRAASAECADRANRTDVDAADLASLRIEPLAPADWVTLSQGKRGPVRAGRFLVHGSHDRRRMPKQRLAIEIDAGQAFGTAHHASTRGCLLALDDLLKRERPRVILDIGTGTGILAIAAAKALKRRVLASDSDRLAVSIAGGNASRKPRRVRCYACCRREASPMPSFALSRPIFCSPICSSSRSTTLRPR